MRASIAIFTVVWIVGAFSQSAAFGALTLLVLGPLSFLFAVI